MNKDYVIGIDFGSDSVRAVVIDIKDGSTVGSDFCEYRRWMQKLYCDASKNMFRQHPLDYLESFEACVKGALKNAGENAGKYVRGIGVDATGSTPCPVDRNGTPLALLPEFAENPNAMFYLWKDHTSIEEAKEINKVFSNFGGEDYLRFQGTYASEWWWAKILHGARTDKKVKEAAYSWVEHCDWIPALLTGNTNPETMYRCSCAAGHKALWHSDFGGLPSMECLRTVDPYLEYVAKHYGKGPEDATYQVGVITKEWAKRLGVNEQTVIGGSSLDAHAGAVGAGVRPKVLVKVIGTSTVDMLVQKREYLRGRDLHDSCGQAENSILPGYVGMEASQAAFGDLCSWFRTLLMWPVQNIITKFPDLTEEQKEKIVHDTRKSLLDEITLEAEQIEDDLNLTIVDWFNGRRYPMINETVQGGMYGLSLGTTAPKLFRSLLLAAVFGSRRIVDSFVSRGVEIDEIITVGGIPKKSPLVMQMLADTLKRPIKVSNLTQACAQGAAMYATVAAGFYKDLEEAQEHMNAGFQKVYLPQEKNFEKYDRLYRQYMKVGRHFEEIQEERNQSRSSANK